ncbi:MAG: hypothetical protein ACK4NW_10030 [Roseinatronobacter sp.]
MSRKPSPKPPACPAEGGRYIRQKDGSLKRVGAVASPETTPDISDVKED